MSGKGTEVSNAKSYPVWVGFLDESIDESFLRQKFKKFGPIRNIQLNKEKGKQKTALIHFHNNDVADMAAQDMNRKDLKGIKIKTRRQKTGLDDNRSNSPAQEAKTKRKDPQQQKADLIDSDKAITDCYYFILNGACKPKQGQKCMYRHLDKLRSSTDICERWLNKNCKSKKCTKLHPSQKYEQELGELKKIPLSRCNSHNAFKCFGECGYNNCNTHFQTEEGLKEHIAKSQPVCLECNAVFFTEEEKANHSHKEKNKKKKKNDPEQGDFIEPIGVFWDIENCQVPKAKSALSVVQKIRSTFYADRREVEFMCVCDTTKEKKEVLEELNRAQINIIHINATSKNAADDKVKQALRRFAQTYAPPATILLISGDINFISELSDLRHRSNFRVILLHNKQASDVLKLTAHECHGFESFTAELQMNPVNTKIDDRPKEIMITNLPPGNKAFKSKVNNKIKQLVDNTGGKIIHLQLTEDGKREFDNAAIVRFADPESAQRAVARLQNETVFGVIINVRLKMKLSKTNKDNNLKISQINPVQPLPNNSNFMHPIPPQILPLMQKPLFNSNGFLPQPYHPMPLALFPQPIYPVMKTVLNGMQPGMFNSKPATTSISSASATNLMNTQQRRNQSNDQKEIEILVEKLDDTPVTNKEFKRRIFDLLNNQFKVSSFSIIQEDKVASIKVPKLIDALWCVHNMNETCLETKKLKFSLCEETFSDPLMKLKVEVFTLLYSHDEKWMSINDFLAAFKTFYKRAFHVLDLDKVKELVHIDGKPQFQFVCLLQNPIGGTKIRLSPDLKKDVVDILKAHNRRVPLASLPGLFWSYTKQKIEFDIDGEMLIELVTNADVCLAGNSPQEQIIFYKKQKPAKDKFYPLEDFQNDIIQLLKASQLYLIGISRLNPMYHHIFGRQLILSEFGFKDLNAIVNALPDILKISQTKMIGFTDSYKKIILHDLLYNFLEARHKQQLLLSSLLTGFYRFYGNKLYYRNFGFESFLDLINSLDHETFKISGTGENKMIMLVRKTIKPNKRIIKKFTEQVNEMIESTPNHEVFIHSLSSDYFKHFGKQLKLTEMGFTKLNDLIAAISGYFQISGERERRYITYLKSTVHFDSIVTEVQSILNRLPDLVLLGIQLPEIYHKFMRKTFPFELANINQLYDKLPPTISVIGNNSHRVLLYDNRADYPSLLFINQMVEIAYCFQHFEFTLNAILIKLKEKGIEATLDRVQREVKKSDKFKVNVSSSGKEKSYCLLPKESQKLFERDILKILSVEENFKLPLNHIAKAYTKMYGKVLRVADYGVNKLVQLLEKLPPGFVEVCVGSSKLPTVLKMSHIDLRTGSLQVEYPTKGGQPTMHLGNVGLACMECLEVVSNNHGSLLLCNFDAEYLKQFRKHLLPKKLGFSKIKDLLECFSCVFNIYGENKMKVVVEKEKLLNPPIRDTLRSNQVETPISENESDSDVIIESESEISTKDTDWQNLENDLLSFSDEQQQKQATKALEHEWWMDTNPNLPEPSLQPEQFANEPEFDLDLISFTEFDDDDILQGGIDESNIPLPTASTSQHLSYNELKERNKSSSDNFVDHLFSNEANTQEPDLMRLLVGRCSPAETAFTKAQPITSYSTTSSTVSDTYSIFSPIKPSSSVYQPTADVPYSQLLGDVFTQGSEYMSNRTIRPKIAANFSKQV